MKKFIVNNWTDAFVFHDNKLSNSPLLFVAALHKLYIHVSVRLLTIKISQSARENFCCYRNIACDFSNTPCYQFSEMRGQQT